MLRVKRENNHVQQGIKFKNTYNIINILPNGNNNIEEKSFLKNNINQNRSNKFLSLPERQRIIREINESKNQIDLNINLNEQLYKNKQIKKKSEDSKNLLYIKKTKSELNLLEKTPNKKNNINNKNVKNQNSKIDIKFTDNRELVNKAIKEYYKKIDNSFKSYLETLNNRYNDNKMKRAQKINNNSNNNNTAYFNINGNKNIQNNNIYKNINVAINEIYKKPNLGKVYNKTNINNIIEENGNPHKTNNNNAFIDLDKLCMISSARREQINCAKMINNGLTKNIFNKINNYNTTTFRNSNINNTTENLIKIDYNSSKNSNKNELLKKTKSSNNFNQNNFKRKNKINEIITTTEIDIKKKERKKEIKLNIIEDEKKENEINNKIKYTKKNIKSPGGIQNKKRYFKSNFLSNDLPKIIIKNDVISIMPYENINTKNEKILINNKNERMELIDLKQLEFERDKKYNRTDKNENNNKRFTPKEEAEKINKQVKTRNKNKKINKSLTFSFKESPDKDERKNKSFSYFSNKLFENEEENNQKNNHIYKNGRYHYKYKNTNDRSITPIYVDKYKYKFNYINYRNKALMAKEVLLNKNKSYNNNNDDDDNMKNQNNSNMEINNNKSFDIRMNNINNSFNLNNINSNRNIFKINKSPIKEYYLNYFSNKINNDFLDEKKFNQFENEILKKHTHTNSESINSFININRNITPLKSMIKSYCPTTINNNNEKEKSKNYFSEKNKKGEYNNNYIKTETSNGKKSPKKISIDLNINNFEEKRNIKSKISQKFKNI